MHHSTVPSSPILSLVHANECKSWKRVGEKTALKISSKNHRATGPSFVIRIKDKFSWVTEGNSTLRSILRRVVPLNAAKQVGVDD